MTDNEIKQALPFLAKYCKDEYNDIRVDEVLLGASELINRLKTKNNQLDETIQQLAEDINRQKAENEKLTEDYNNLIYEKDLLFDEAEAQIKAKNAEIKEWKRVVETWLMVHEKDKAEIERLQKAGEEAVSCFHRMESLYNIKRVELKVAKAEAIKELMFNLDNEISTYSSAGKDLNVYAWLKNYAKEMVGETE